MNDNQDLKFFTKKLFIGGTALSLATMSDKVIAVILIPVFTFYLSPTEFGLVSISMVIVSFLSMIYNPGVISASLRLFYDMDSLEEKKELITSTFVMLLVPGGLILVFSLFWGENAVHSIFNQYQFYPYGLIAVVLALLVQPIRLWSTIWVAFNKEFYIAKSFFVRLIIATVISILLVVFAGLGAFGKLLGQLSGQLLVFSVVITSILKLGKFRFSLATMKKVFMLGFPLFFSVWSYVVLDIGDRYLIERLIDLKSVGLYDVGYKIAALPILFSSGFNQVWTPIYYQNLKNKSFEIISKLLTYFLLFLTLLCGTLILFSRELFLFFINSKYIASSEIVPYVTLGVFFLGTSTIFSSALSYQKKFKTFSIIISLSAILNIGLNFLLIPRFGIAGAALSTLLSYLFQNVSGYILTKKFTREYFPRKRIVIISLFIFISFIAVILLKDYPLSLIMFSAKIGILISWLALLFYARILSRHEFLSLLTYIRGKLRSNKK